MQSSILTLHIDLCKCDWNTINLGVIHMCLSLFFFLRRGGFLKDVWTLNSPLRFIKYVLLTFISIIYAAYVSGVCCMH